MISINLALISPFEIVFFFVDSVCLMLNNLESRLMSSNIDAVQQPFFLFRIDVIRIKFYLLSFELETNKKPCVSSSFFALFLVTSDHFEGGTMTQQLHTGSDRSIDGNQSHQTNNDELRISTMFAAASTPRSAATTTDQYHHKETIWRVIIDVISLIIRKSIDDSLFLHFSTQRSGFYFQFWSQQSFRIMLLNLLLEVFFALIRRFNIPTEKIRFQRTLL